MAGESCSSVGLCRKKENEYSMLGCSVFPEQSLRSRDSADAFHEPVAPCGEQNSRLMSSPFAALTSLTLSGRIAFSRPAIWMNDDSVSVISMVACKSTVSWL
eukprot:626022-Rhodomonas_salina.1